MPYSFLPHLAYIKKPNSKKKVNLIGGKGGDGGKSKTGIDGVDGKDGKSKILNIKL